MEMLFGSYISRLQLHFYRAVGGSLWQLGGFSHGKIQLGEPQTGNLKLQGIESPATG